MVTARDAASAPTSGSRQSTLPRTIRIASGCIIFAFVVTHLLNLAFGLWSLEVLDALRPVFMLPWHNPVGFVVLYAAIALHMVFAFEVLLRKRTLRMSGYDALQLGMALIFPPLVILHILGTRGAFMQFGFEPTYAGMMMVFWKFSPASGLRQVLVVLVAWVHGCMGLYYWLRLKQWWPRYRGLLYALAFVVPVAALLGFVEGGREALHRSADPEWMAPIEQNMAVLDDARRETIARAQNIFLIAYLCVLACVFALRAWLLRHDGKREIEVRYAKGRTVRVAAGLSLLDISREQDISHEHLCGGRGRCGTCRVRVLEGAQHLPPPSPLEQATLNRIAADKDMRLACQAIARGSPIVLERVIIPDFDEDQPEATTGNRNIVVLDVRISGQERVCESVGADDAFAALNRCTDEVTSRIRSLGGEVERVSTDGVRALFGLTGTPKVAARNALRAARALTQADETGSSTALSRSAWLHAGQAYVGEFGHDTQSRIVAMGDVIAGGERFDAARNEDDVVMVVSDAVFALAGIEKEALQWSELTSGENADSVAMPAGRRATRTQALALSEV